MKLKVNKELILATTLSGVFTYLLVKYAVPRGEEAVKKLVG